MWEIDQWKWAGLSRAFMGICGKECVSFLLLNASVQSPITALKMRWDSPVMSYLHHVCLFPYKIKTVSLELSF
jgi:hypothetical protein